MGPSIHQKGSNCQFGKWIEVTNFGQVSSSWMMIDMQVHKSKWAKVSTTITISDEVFVRLPKWIDVRDIVQWRQCCMSGELWNSLGRKYSPYLKFQVSDLSLANPSKHRTCFAYAICLVKKRTCVIVTTQMSSQRCALRAKASLMQALFQWGHFRVHRDSPPFPMHPYLNDLCLFGRRWLLQTELQRFRRHVFI